LKSIIKHNNHNIGAEINIDFKFRPDFELFGESHSRIIMTASPENIDEVKSICDKHNFNFEIIGTVGSESLRINDIVNVRIDELRNSWENTIKL